MGINMKVLTLEDLSYYDRKIKEYISQEKDETMRETLGEIVNYLQSNPQEASMSIEFNQPSNNTFSSMIHAMGHSAIEAGEALQKVNDVLQKQEHTIADMHEADNRITALEVNGHSFQNSYYNDLNDILNRMDSVEEKLQKLSDVFEEKVREEVKIALEQEKEERGKCRENLNTAIPKAEVSSVTKLDVADPACKNTIVEVTSCEIEELFGGDPFERRKIVFKEKERLF